MDQDHHDGRLATVAMDRVIGMAGCARRMTWTAPLTKAVTTMNIDFAALPAGWSGGD